MADLTNWLCIEQRDVIKYFFADKWKPCKICRRMCHVYEEKYSSQSFTNEINGALLLQAWFEKLIHWKEKHTHTLSLSLSLSL